MNPKPTIQDLFEAYLRLKKTAQETEKARQKGKELMLDCIDEIKLFEKDPEMYYKIISEI